MGPGGGSMGTVPQKPKPFIVHTFNAIVFKWTFRFQNVLYKGHYTIQGLFVATLPSSINS